MTFEEWYADFSKFWGASTKQDVAQCMDVIQAAYKAGMLRAAEICKQKHENMDSRLNYVAGWIDAEAAIRKEAKDDR